MRRIVLSIASILLIGAIMRFPVIVNPAELPDLEHYRATIDIVQRGGNIYVDQWFYNYSPLPAHLFAALDSIVPDYRIAHRVMLSISQLIIGLLLWSLTRKRTVFALIWCNPAFVMLIYLENHELLAIMPVIGALWLYSSSARWRYSLSKTYFRLFGSSLQSDGARDAAHST